MSIELLLKYSGMAFVVLCVGIVVLMGRKRLLREFPLLAALLCLQAAGGAITLATLFFRQTFGMDRQAAYNVYFYAHWVSLVAEGVLRILIIYSVFSLAMKPLQGLHQIGKVIFRWVAAVSVMVSAAIAIGPHFVTPGYGLTMAIARVTGQIQQGISVLTLCLLLFVCFSTKPLGLTYRSRLFGITLGLGVMATATLIQAAWFSTTGAHSLYSPIYLFGVLGSFASTSVWATYFALPEPERKLILLPTTSPFFFWNRISEALGDSPGHVAIAGFRPDMLAPAEMQMLSAPSTHRIEQPIAEFDRHTLSAPSLLTAASH
jgi:hypothetical protein